MINTELHNAIIEKELENKLIASDRVNQIAKRAVLIEKLKSSLLIIGVVFIALLLLVVLMWLLPSKNFGISFGGGTSGGTAINKTCDCNSTKKKQLPLKIEEPTKKDTTKEGKPKNGTEYVKYDNYVYKRVWKDGILIEETKLEKTIEKSRKTLKEKIPRLSVPKK